MQVLKQEQYKPLKQYEQVIILVVVLNHLLQDIPVNEIKTVISEILIYFNEKHFDIVESIETSGELSDECRKNIVQIAEKYLQER